MSKWHRGALSILVLGAVLSIILPVSLVGLGWLVMATGMICFIVDEPS